MSSGHRVFGNSYIPVSDYCYCVYLLGFLVHSVTLYDVERDCVVKVFGKKEVL